MLPSEALPEDWRMYYNNCWMRHRRHGIGLIQIVGGMFYLYTFPDDVMESEPQRVNHEALECWWPRPGAYNTPQGAVYIARKSTRTMRKSATMGDHYYVSWGSKRGTNGYMPMLVMRRGADFVDIPFGLKVINDGLSNSVAVSRELIINRTPTKELQVLFRGREVGVMQNGDFIPLVDSPMSRRAHDKLIVEGGL
jgi:hypothetical protein